MIYIFFGSSLGNITVLSFIIAGYVRQILGRGTIFNMVVFILFFTDTNELEKTMHPRNK